MNNGTVEASFEQAKAPKVVNRDEVTREMMHIPLSIYKDEPLTLDDGTPFLDEKGNQYIGRVVAGTRTAKIKNIAPIDLYTRAVAMFDGVEAGFSINKLTKEQLDSMTDMLLECWKISEPFMTKEMLREGIDGLHLIEIFTQIFFRMSPPSSSSPSPDASTTQSVG